MREVSPRECASWGTSNFYRHFFCNVENLSPQTACTPNFTDKIERKSLLRIFSCNIFQCNIFFIQNFFHVTNLLFRIIQTFSFIERLTIFLLIWNILKSVFLFCEFFERFENQLFSKILPIQAIL